MADDAIGCCELLLCAPAASEIAILFDWMYNNIPLLSTEKITTNTKPASMIREYESVLLPLITKTIYYLAVSFLGELINIILNEVRGLLPSYYYEASPMILLLYAELLFLMPPPMFDFNYVR